MSINKLPPAPAPPTRTAEEILACLFAEYTYWKNAECADGISIGATGAISNVIAFATLEDYTPDHLLTESNVVEGTPRSI